MKLLVSDSLVEDVVLVMHFVYSRCHRFVLVFGSYLDFSIGNAAITVDHGDYNETDDDEPKCTNYDYGGTVDALTKEFVTFLYRARDRFIFFLWHKEWVVIDCLARPEC